MKEGPVEISYLKHLLGEDYKTLETIYARSSDEDFESNLESALADVAGVTKDKETVVDLIKIASEHRDITNISKLVSNVSKIAENTKDKETVVNVINTLNNYYVDSPKKGIKTYGQAFEENSKKIENETLTTKLSEYLSNVLDSREIYEPFTNALGEKDFKVHSVPKEIKNNRIVMLSNFYRNEFRELYDKHEDKKLVTQLAAYFGVITRDDLCENTEDKINAVFDVLQKHTDIDLLYGLSSELSHVGTNTKEDNQTLITLCEVLNNVDIERLYYKYDNYNKYNLQVKTRCLVHIGQAAIVTRNKNDIEEYIKIFEKYGDKMIPMHESIDQHDEQEEKITSKRTDMFIRGLIEASQKGLLDEYFIQVEEALKPSSGLFSSNRSLSEVLA